MRIDVLRNCFRRDGSKAPTILKRNTVHTLPDDEAVKLIEAGYAVELKDEKEVKKEAKKEEKKEDEKKEEKPEKTTSKK